MMELLTSPEAWAALLTLTALEIVLGIDNVIFLSVIVSRIPPDQAKRARQIGLLLALVFRILLIGGGLFLIAKATHEIHVEVEARDVEPDAKSKAGAFFLVIIQIIVIDM